MVRLHCCKSTTWVAINCNTDTRTKNKWTLTPFVRSGWRQKNWAVSENWCQKWILLLWIFISNKCKKEQVINQQPNQVENSFNFLFGSKIAFKFHHKIYAQFSKESAWGIVGKNVRNKNVLRDIQNCSYISINISFHNWSPKLIKREMWFSNRNFMETLWKRYYLPAKS